MRLKKLSQFFNIRNIVLCMTAEEMNASKIKRLNETR